MDAARTTLLNDFRQGVLFSRDNIIPADSNEVPYRWLDQPM